MYDIVYLDVTELVAKPLRTGIQRLERELIRHWAGPARLVPVRFQDSRGLVELHADVFTLLNEDPPPGGDVVAAERERLAPYLRDARPLELAKPGSAVLVPELFYDSARCSFYENLPMELKAKTYFFVHDFLPHLHPENFPQGTAVHCMSYLRVLRSSSNCSFNSNQTRRDFGERIVRRRNLQGPVVPLGGDGLGLERQSFSIDKRGFTVIGTIEPRKQVAQVIRAFALLWKKGVNVELDVVGFLLSHATAEQELLAAFADEPRLHYRAHVSDDELRSILRKVRATIFVSKAEGFGIPPYESLYAGIPVICCDRGVPSLDLISRSGQIRLDDTEPASIANAVEALLDDETARRVWEEAARVSIPTWQSFADQIANWVCAADTLPSPQSLSASIR
jgi:glycosyltransferase involved in cell wall biosynthesis